MVYLTQKCDTKTCGPIGQNEKKKLCCRMMTTGTEVKAGDESSAARKELKKFLDVSSLLFCLGFCPGAWLGISDFENLGFGWMDMGNVGNWRGSDLGDKIASEKTKLTLECVFLHFQKLSTNKIFQNKVKFSLEDLTTCFA